MYAAYGLGAVVAVVLVLASLRLIDWFWPLILGVYGGGLCVLVWLVIGIVGLVRYRSSWPYVLAPVLVFGTVGATLATGAPTAAQWRLSESALTTAADECRADTDVRIGLYRFAEVEPVGDAGCVFYLHGSFLDRDGFARLPDADRATAADGFGLQITPWHDDWYTVVWPF